MKQSADIQTTSNSEINGSRMVSEILDDELILNWHKMVDRIDDDRFLRAIYSFLSQREN